MRLNLAALQDNVITAGWNIIIIITCMPIHCIEYTVKKYLKLIYTDNIT